ncbi:ATP-dependent Clp protease (apicoplast) [Babesia microti strain RI]|uniref:ATP-dependent Clp protease n=1 Tax=Babesia microti (strain RI) TaxID=1133968 RepID=A0A068W7K3_BABMR|nr:ATP-dependent Clp protease [Babesia microti strain RI]CDR32608.1 ATP-dependent Clp protease [Babesia microti strain RI]|eukprot:YP_009363177.1 ATP-dependent Clp protease (apicoplast) [Babesia microti strain RI]
MNQFFNKINYKNYIIIYFNNFILYNYKNYINLYKLIINDSKIYYYNFFRIYNIINFINLFFNNDIWIIECDYNNINLISKYFKNLIGYSNKGNILLYINYNNIKNINNIYSINNTFKRVIIIIKDLSKIKNIINNYLDYIYLNLKNKKIIFIINNDIEYNIVNDIILKKFNNNTFNIIKKINNKINIKINNYNNILNINFIDNTDICYKLLDRCIYGQDLIISVIKKNIKDIFNNFNKKNKKPLNSWLLCGPSGTGKTEIAKILSKSIYGNIGKLLKFDMSEYQESHSISKLIGTPPGYIGYTEGSRLINLINKNPYSIILFDEIEKAHKNINNIMLQILDEGILSSSTGVKGIFKYSFILFTSNLGQKNYIYDINNKKIYKKHILNSINNYFLPEFLNRINEILIFEYQNFNYLMKTLNKFFLEFEYVYNTNFIFSLISKNLLYNLLNNKLYGARILNKQSYKFISKLIELFYYINFNNSLNINNNKNILNIYKYNNNKSVNKGIFFKYNNNLI